MKQTGMAAISSSTTEPGSFRPSTFLPTPHSQTDSARPAMVPARKQPEASGSAAAGRTRAGRRASRTCPARLEFGRCRSLGPSREDTVHGGSHVLQVEGAVLPEIKPAGDEGERHRHPFGDFREPPDPGFGPAAATPKTAWPGAPHSIVAVQHEDRDDRRRSARWSCVCRSRSAASTTFLEAASRRRPVIASSRATITTAIQAGIQFSPRTR